MDQVLSFAALLVGVALIIFVILDYRVMLRWPGTGTVWDGAPSIRVIAGSVRHKETETETTRITVSEGLHIIRLDDDRILVAVVDILPPDAATSLGKDMCSMARPLFRDEAG